MFRWLRGIFGKAPQRRDQRDAQIAELQARYAHLRATYDAARNTAEFANYWANADRYDADSAHSREVRHTLISRSRYEIGNNGYSDGIAQTYSTDLIGNAPALRMQTGSPGLNQLVELEWHRWCKAIQFRRKLWTMAHAKHTDGEAIAIIRRNPRVRHAVQLDLQLVEAEQCQTADTLLMDGRIDGIRFDEFGNPTVYEILRHHPGSRTAAWEAESEFVPATQVLHWFKMRRPGQHRGVPETSSTLNLGAGARRWREANLTAAERAALLTLMMKTQMTPEEADQVAPFSTMDIEKGLMSFLPAGWEMQQADGKFPTATYESFHKSLLNEQARPKNMPYNKAACDSSSYNYASGRLDHQTYYAALDVEREDCNDLVLDPLFELWFNEAIYQFGWFGGNFLVVGPAAREHSWDWPKHRVADVLQEAEANRTKLESGQIFIQRLFSDNGWDFDDECTACAAAFGVPVETLKTRLFDVLLPAVKQEAPKSPAVDPPSDALSEALAAFPRKTNGVHVNGN
jgi:capsid protein